MANSKFLETVAKWKDGIFSIPRKSSIGSSLEDVLIFSSNNEIYVLDNNQHIKRIGKRDKPVTNFCLNDGKIYDASGHSIFETLENKEVAYRDHKINALCSYNNILHDAEGYNINETLENQKIAEGDYDYIRLLCPHEKELYYSSGHEVFVLGKSAAIASREKYIDDLIVHDGFLCDLTPQEIHNTITNKDLVKRTRGDKFCKMCSHKGILYYLNYSDIFTNQRERPITKRDHYVSGLCIHNGKLYDFGENTPLMETKTENVIVNKMGIRAAESYPRKLFVDSRVLRR